MSRQQQIIWAVVVVVVLVGLYWWWSSSQSSMTSTNTSTTTSQTGSPMIPAATSTTNSTLPMQATVMFNGSSFSPASVTVAQGGTVTWTSTNGDIWIASNPHPIHNGYDGTTMQQHCAPGYTGPTPFDQCAGGTTYSFTFNQVGTWGYHDHLDVGIKGSVTVVAAQ